MKLEAISEINGNQFTSMAEFNLLDASGNLLPRTGWAVGADSFEPGTPAANAVDGNTTTIWHTAWSASVAPLPHAFTVDLGVNTPIGGFKYLPRQDSSPNGQILGYNFYTSLDGVTWTKVANGSFSADKTEKRVTIVSIANHNPVLTTVANQTGVVGTPLSVALSATDVDGDTIAYAASGLPTGLTINTTNGLISGTPTTAGTYTVGVAVSDGKGGTASQSFTWTVTATASVPAGRYVKLEAISEINGNQFTSMADFNLFSPSGATLARTNWVASVDSFEPGTPAANAIDASTSSIWHTTWSASIAPLPHALTVDLGTSMQIGGFTYLPRQDGSVNGQIKGYNFYTSTDGVNWTLASHGTLSTADVTLKKVTIATQ
jgi:hypothetical protein